jgi:hypothetical protein
VRRLAVLVMLAASLVLWAASARSARADPPAAGAAGLRGIVVDPEGAAVAGVAVRADFGHTKSSGDWKWRWLIDDGSRRAITDACGRFAVDAPGSAAWAVVNVDAPGWVQPEPRLAYLGSGTYVIRAPRSLARTLIDKSPPPFTDAMIPADARAMHLLDGASTWPRLRIILERGAPVAGTVETEAGLPVLGGAVTASWLDGHAGWRYAEIRADERGRFSILVPSDSAITADGATIEGKPDVARRALAWPVPPGTGGLRLVMRDLAPLALRARWGPLEGAWVRLGLAGFPDEQWRLQDRWCWVSPHPATGSFRIERLLPGTYSVEVRPRSMDLLPVTARVSIPGDPLEISWPPATPVEGRLEGTDLEDFEITWTGEGDEYRTVRIGTTAWPPGLLSEGSRGMFRLGTGGPGAICARRDGDPRCAFVPDFAPSRGFLLLVLGRGEVIRGRAEGQPGLDLSALRVRAVARALTAEARVQPDGGFAIVGLPPGAFRIELRSGAWLHDARDDVPAGAEDVRLRVRLPDTDPGVSGP